MSGKGDDRRPQQIPEDEMAANWARIFGNKQPEPRKDAEPGN